MPVKTNALTHSRNILILGGLLIFSLIALPLDLRFVHSINFVSSDFFTFWLAGRMNWTGEDPYSTSQWLADHAQYGADWVSDPVFSYPLPLAFFLAPIGLLPVDLAYAIWIDLAQVSVVVSVLLLMFQWSSPKLKHYVLPLLTGAFIFRPTLVTFTNGQLGAFVLLVLTLAVWFWKRGRWFSGGAILALVLLKPTLAIPIIALVVVWLMARRQRWALYGLGLAAVALFVIGFMRDPAWVLQFLRYGGAKLAGTFGYAPNLWGVANALCQYQPRCSLPLGGALSTGCLVVGLALLLRNRRDLSPFQVMCLIVPTALLATPYIWAYDQILLILPVTLVTLVLMARGWPYLLSALLFFMLSVGAWLLVVVAAHVGNDVWSALVPFIGWLLAVWQAATIVPKTEDKPASVCGRSPL